MPVDKDVLCLAGTGSSSRKRIVQQAGITRANMGAAVACYALPLR